MPTIYDCKALYQSLKQEKKSSISSHGAVAIVSVAVQSSNRPVVNAENLMEADNNASVAMHTIESVLKNALSIKQRIDSNIKYNFTGRRIEGFFGF